MEAVVASIRKCGPLVRRIRQKRNKTLPQLAEASGKTVQLLSMFELGKCGVSLSTLTKSLSYLKAELVIQSDGRLMIRTLKKNGNGN